jgi:hypothetical protein
LVSLLAFSTAAAPSSITVSVFLSHLKCLAALTTPRFDGNHTVCTERPKPEFALLAPRLTTLPRLLHEHGSGEESCKIDDWQSLIPPDYSESGAFGGRALQLFYDFLQDLFIQRQIRYNPL